LAFVLFTFDSFAGPALDLPCDEAKPVLSRRQIVARLHREGFPEIMLDKVSHLQLKQLGNIKTSKTSCFSIIVYTAELPRGPGSETHRVACLLVLKNSHYLGMYAIDNLPLEISDNTVNFRGEEKSGNKIVFDQEDPPRQIHLDGELRSFFKD
jgi:hypothetical protein